MLPHYSITCSFTEKACKYAIKRDSKIFLEIHKRIERLQQNTLVKLRFLGLDSEQAQR